jgi:DNA (cytosine-5)-methyltransferase 3A
MIVLSLFDGISAGQLALQRAGIKVDTYIASEIEPNVIAVTTHNFPGTIQVGDVCNVKGKDLPKIDLLLGGNPCQSFSNCGNKENFDDPRGKLFFEYVRLLNECKPKWFLLENVKFKKEWQEIFTKHLGVEPVEINSALLSAQNRVRLYWVGKRVDDHYEQVIIPQPEDKGIKLKDIILPDASEPVLHNIYGGFKEKKPRTFWDKSPTIRTAAGGGHIPSLILTEKALKYMDRKVKDGRTHWDFKHHSDIKNDKSQCVTANMHKGVPYNVLVTEKCIRYFDPIEIEYLQTMPDNFTKYGIVDGKTREMSKTQRYKMAGNSWTVDIIAHILKSVLKSKKKGGTNNGY